MVATALVAWSTHAGAQTLPIPVTAPYADAGLEPAVESDSGSNPPAPGYTLTLPFGADVTVALPGAPTDGGSPPPDSGAMAEDDSAATSVSASGCLAAALLSSRAPDGCNVPTAGVSTPAQVTGSGDLCVDGAPATATIGGCSEAGVDAGDPSAPIDPGNLPGAPGEPGSPEEPLSSLCDLPIVGDIVSDIVCPESTATPPATAPAPGTAGDSPGLNSPPPTGGGSGTGSGRGAPTGSAAGDGTSLTGALPFTGGSTAGRLAMLGSVLVGFGLAARRWGRLSLRVS